VAVDAAEAGRDPARGEAEEEQRVVPLGGAALYLAAHVALRLRNVGTLSVQRVVAALVLLALVPVALEVEALVTLALLTAVLAALIAFEVVRFAEARARAGAGV